MDLSNFGLKNTKARECLINLLKESKDPKTAEELYLNLPQGLTNLSTVYRTLHTFCEAGIISKEIRPDGKALYSYSSFEHHHVLICIKCNKNNIICVYHIICFIYNYRFVHTCYYRII